ncbi:MAG: phosphoribosylformylglycinamidine synthase I [Methanobacteriota archaeon]|nr:MAG: phosphoribosylformylglycinamidine synthase I [Euryarchaeota archaeon]
MVTKPKTIVLRVEGTNCDEETAHAFEVAGSEVDRVHINQLVRSGHFLDEYQILVIPGGFSHGDAVSAGILLANQLRYQIGDQVKEFIADNKLVLGICNGFQALVRAGFLPSPDKQVEATLTLNDSGLFYDGWVHLNHVNRGTCIYTQQIKDVLYLPVAHAEGKFVTTRKNLEKLEENDQIVFTYVENPNGSVGNVAGVCNPEGNVLGMMPHPERYIHKYMHPQWTRLPELPEEGDGLKIFQNAVKHAKKHL